MNELQRLAYLDVMAVDSYIPRLQLIAAKASVLCDMPASIEVVAKLSTETSITAMHRASSDRKLSLEPKVSSNSESRAAEAMALFNESSQSIVAPTVKTSLVVDDKKTIAKPAVLASSLSIIRLPKLLIIDESLPGNINVDDYQQLIQNILFTLGFEPAAIIIESFSGPWVRNNQLDDSETAAKEALQSFLEKQIEELQLSYIVVLGDKAANYINVDELSKGSLITHPQLSAQIIHTHGAIGLLSNPINKEAVWRDLKPLYLALKAH